MKIAFVGKGGSGKTTITSLLVRHLASQGLPVLAVDSDLNQHLGEAIGLSPDLLKKLPSLGVETDRLYKHIIGENPRLKNSNIIRTTPPGSGSVLMRPFLSNEVMGYFAHTENGITFMQVGQPPIEQIGAKCYHANMSAGEVLLNHIIDTPDEYIIVDLTAGIDTIISGMFISYDIIFVVVEPTKKSLSVFQDYQEYLNSLGDDTRLIPIANKVAKAGDYDFILNTLGIESCITFPVSDSIRRFEQGDESGLFVAQTEYAKQLQDMQQVVNSVEKNWLKFYNRLITFHKRKAASDKSTEHVLLEQIDPEFNIEELIKRALD